jgi:hypothetical protein
VADPLFVCSGIVRDFVARQDDLDGWESCAFSEDPFTSKEFVFKTLMGR